MGGRVTREDRAREVREYYLALWDGRTVPIVDTQMLKELLTKPR